MPNAIVNGSPRSIGRSPGLSRPKRGPRAGGQHQVARQRRAVPAEQRDRLALGHARAAGRSSTLRTPLDVVHAAHSIAASCSTSLMTRSPSAGVDEQVGRRSRRAPLAPTSPRSSSTRNAGTSIIARSGVRLPADDADPAAGADALVAEDLGERPRPVARLARQAEVLEQMAAHRQRRGAGHARSTRCRRGSPGRPSGADDEDRLLEARVEAGQVGEVRAVLAVGVDDERS